MKLLILLISLFTISCTKDNIEPKNIIPFIISDIVIDGNSLAYGSGSFLGGYSKVLKDSGYIVKNVAISGQTILQMITSCLDVNDSLDNNSILIVDECTNELYNGSSVDTTYNRLKRYCNNERLQNNIKIIVVTPTPIYKIGMPIDFEYRRLQLINKIKISNFYDGLANAGEDSLIGTGNAQNALYFYDGVHHTELGYKIRGQIILKAIKIL